MSDTTYTVESNIPLWSRSKYPWDGMLVGDSFFVPGMKVKPRRLAFRVASAISTAKSKHPGVNYKYRQVYENNCYIGCRVWRIQ